MIKWKLMLFESGLGYKEGAAAEQNIAKAALKSTVAVFKWVHQRRETMERGRVQLYASSKILKDVKGCISAKQNKGSETDLTQKMVLEQLTKAEKCMKAYPNSYYRKVASGAPYGEPILKELGVCRSILGEQHKSMVEAAHRAKKSRESTETKQPSSFNTKYSVVPTQM